MPTNFMNIDSATINLDFILGANDVVYDSSIPRLTTTIPVTLNDTVTIGKNVVGTTTSVPLFDLIPHSASVSLFRFTADVSNAIVLENFDNSDVLNSSLDSAGKFYSRQVAADNFIVGTHEQSVGAVTLTFSGPSLFSVDTSGGDVTYTLPTLTSGSPSGYKFTFKKTDVSANPVMVSASGGQEIDGVSSKNLTSQWSVLKIVSVVSGGSGYWLVI